MAATAEWVDIPFTLQSPYATISLNAATGDRYLMVQSGCDMGAPLRVTKDNVPASDGSILHRRWFSGYEARLSLMLWYNDEPACGADLVRMMDTLNGICWSLRDAGDDEGRLLWTPTGKAIRMLDDIRLLERLVAVVGESGGVTCTFAVDTAYPYAQDFTQISTALGATVNNTGTAEYWPVIQVSGSSTFVITNTTTGLEMVYNANLPGGVTPGVGDYIEFDFFRNTAYLNGNQDNCKGGIDIGESDFWSLIPGNNTITLSSGSGTMLWAPAYA